MSCDAVFDYQIFLEMKISLYMLWCYISQASLGNFENMVFRRFFRKCNLNRLTNDSSKYTIYNCSSNGIVEYDRFLILITVNVVVKTA